MAANATPGKPSIRNDEVAALKARLRKLAEDKSNLQLIVRLMEHINPLPGVEDMIRSLLASIVETIGGTNIKLYYWIGTELRYADFTGRRDVPAAIDDPSVAQVAQSREFLEERGGETMLTKEQVAGAWTWTFPLVVGSELVGVIKIENLHISGSSLRDVLPVFFSHAALILSNEIRNFSRQQAEEIQKRLSRELRAISDCNQALLRAEDEQVLLDQVCRIICDEAGYLVAFVAFAEHDAEQTVRPVAWAGMDEDYFAGAKLTWADRDLGRGPIGTAIRTGQVVEVPDIATDPRMAPWRDRAWARGYRSGVAFPLKDDQQKAFGALLIYSGEANAITVEEIRLLDELAGDLAFGITALRTRAEHRKSDAKLAASEQLFRALVENSPDPIARYDRELRRIYVNPAIRKLFKAPVEQVLGNTPAGVSPLVDPDGYMANIRRVIETAEDRMDEGAFRTLDGEIRWSSWRFTPELGADGKVATVLVVSHDITERKRAEEDRRAHLHFLESMDRVNRAIQGTNDLDQMMSDVLQVVLDIFACDRAFLLHPCDPNDTHWTVPMERTRPEYPGVLALNQPIPMDNDVAKTLQTLLDHPGPLLFGPETGHPLPTSAAERFGIKSFISMALHPKTGKPWQLGLHQCSRLREWKPDEVRLFEETGRRLSDALDTLLTTRNLRESESGLRLAASVFATSQEGIMISNPDNRIIDVNPAFTRLTGYEREEALGRDPNLLSSGRHNADFYTAMWRSIKTRGAWQGEIWNRRKSGGIFAELLSIVAVKDDRGQLQHYVGAFSDISVLKEHEADLDRIAHYDVLTSVPNRRLLSDRLEQAIARARRLGKNLAVCYLDLDGFKPINDQFGHEGGDRLLVEVARRLQANSRGDDTVARLGGDEFVLLWNDIGPESECFQALDRILAEVSSPMVLDGVQVSVSASIGVTLYPDDNVDADSLLRHADHAMYSAKQLGKNRYQLFDSRLERQISSRFEFLTKVGHALDRGQFELFYQPKVDCVAGTVIGVEALIRWNDPVLGMVGPKEFLPLIENDNLALRTGRWVVEQAVRQARLWNEKGIVLPISVNVFPRHLKYPTFIDDLRNAIALHWPGIPKDRLLMEIVETSDLEELDPIEAVITECLNMGIGFSLDDFGTGYSSLVYLRRLSVEELKIDQSFVRDMMSDPNDQAIVVGVIGLGKAFGLRVVAEGVESERQAHHLVALGCSVVQGYGLGRPMPAHDLEKWLADFSVRGVNICQ
jgi:diguanylate cyclase (GGDEF)-like protein/PAS domain S-box-containing protein